MVNRFVACAAGLLMALAAAVAAAGECRLAPAPNPPEGVDASIVAQLGEVAVAVTLVDDEEEASELCRFWVAKAWTLGLPGEVTGDFAPIQYPIAPGSLVGMIQLSRGCLDFREQPLPQGVYTVRYAVQPDMDVHRESHDSRDFLVLLPSDEDRSAEAMVDPEQLIKLSAKVAMTTHPAIIPLLEPAEAHEACTVRRDDRDPDGWILSLPGRDADGKAVPLDLILLKPDPNQ